MVSKKKLSKKKHKCIDYSPKNRRFEIWVPGTPENIRLDIQNGHWYELVRGKKGQYKRKRGRKRLHGLVPLEINNHIYEKFIENNNEGSKISKGIYYINAQFDVVDQHNIKLGTGLEARLQMIFVSLIGEALINYKNRLDRFTLRHHNIEFFKRKIYESNYFEQN